MKDDVAIQYIHMFFKGMDLLFRMLPLTRSADVGVIENSPVEYVYKFLLLINNLKSNPNPNLPSSI